VSLPPKGGPRGVRKTRDIGRLEKIFIPQDSVVKIYTRGDDGQQRKATK